jgi:hypothetical protein
MNDKRIESGTMMAVYVAVYILAVAVILLDLLVWRPW